MPNFKDSFSLQFGCKKCLILFFLCADLNMSLQDVCTDIVANNSTI